MAGAWSAPVIALAVATPAHAASVRVGGTLFLVGNAYPGTPGGIYLAGSNYNGAGSTETYTTNAVRITITLPEVDGISDTLIDASPGLDRLSSAEYRNHHERRHVRT